MIQFIKDSVRELSHVVWPTREETRNFFLVVLVILIAF
jgi:preprotein translocase SecE subunit